MRSYFRINTNYSLYSEIAREYNRSALINLSELNKINFEENYLENIDGISVLENKIDKDSAITVVFAAMALEAFIYDYAAITFGDNYVNKYIDKMDVVAKWLVVPRLITGKEIPRDRHCFQLLNQLIKLRNEFVHSKSKNYNKDTIINFINKYTTQKMVEYSNDAVNTINELANELEFIDPESHAKAKLHCF